MKPLSKMLLWGEEAGAEEITFATRNISYAKSSYGVEGDMISGVLTVYEDDYSSNTTVGSDVFLANFYEDGNDYSLYLGYAFDMRGQVLDISNDITGTDIVTISLKRDVQATSVDFFAERNNVRILDYFGDVYGNMVFIRTIDDVFAEERVVYENPM